MTIEIEAHLPSGRHQSIFQCHLYLSASRIEITFSEARRILAEGPTALAAVVKGAYHLG